LPWFIWSLPHQRITALNDFTIDDDYRHNAINDKILKSGACVVKLE